MQSKKTSCGIAFKSGVRAGRAGGPFGGIVGPNSGVGPSPLIAGLGNIVGPNSAVGPNS